jgi:hypothetical protein
MSSVKISDVDRGYKDLVTRIFGLSASKISIEVGILEDEPHGDDAISMIELGTIHEFGTATIPERSFIRAWFDEQEPELRTKFAELMKSVVEGKRSKEDILELMGLYCVGQMQARMAAGIEPGNAPSTIARKGSSTPLIDTGVLRSSISHRVVEGGGGE